MSAEDATDKHVSPTNSSESLDPTSASTSEEDKHSLNTTRESKETNGSGPEKLTENGHVDQEAKEGKEAETREAEAEGALSTNQEPEPELTGGGGAGEPSSESFTESGDSEPTEVAEGGPSWSEEDHEHKRVKVSSKTTHVSPISSYAFMSIMRCFIVIFSPFFFSGGLRVLIDFMNFACRSRHTSASST